MPGSAKAMPALGFITMPDYMGHSHNETYNAVLKYLLRGGRLIETSPDYHDERVVGKAIRDSGVPREEIWVTTKVNPGLTPWLKPDPQSKVARSVKESLEKLQLSYVDLLALHFGPYSSMISTEENIEAWKDLIAAKRAGTTRNIGVQMHSRSDIERLISETGERPAVVSTWHSPFVPTEQEDYVQWLQRQGFAVQTYAFLNWATPARANFISGGKTLRAQKNAVEDVARNYTGATWAQVAIRLELDHGFATVNRMEGPQMLEENLNCLSTALTAEERAHIAQAPKWSCSLLERIQPLPGCHP